MTTNHGTQVMLKGAFALDMGHQLHEANMHGVALDVMLVVTHMLIDAHAHACADAHRAT